jgi:hypothetical protein
VLAFLRGMFGWTVRAHFCTVIADVGRFVDSRGPLIDVIHHHGHVHAAMDPIKTASSVCVRQQRFVRRHKSLLGCDAVPSRVRLWPMQVACRMHRIHSSDASVAEWMASDASNNQSDTRHYARLCNRCSEMPTTHTSFSCQLSSHSHGH